MQSYSQIIAVFFNFTPNCSSSKIIHSSRLFILLCRQVIHPIKVNLNIYCESFAYIIAVGAAGGKEVSNNRAAGEILMLQRALSLCPLQRSKFNMVDDKAQGRKVG